MTVREAREETRKQVHQHKQQQFSYNVVKLLEKGKTMKLNESSRHWDLQLCISTVNPSPVWKLIKYLLVNFNP
jgi:hypothetical protein